jgi:hypothetical protein
MDVKPDARGDYRTEGPLGPHADELRVAMGTGRFVIAIPIRLDWSQGQLMLTPQCSEKAAGSPHAMCQYLWRLPFGTLIGGCLMAAQIAGGIGMQHPRTARLASVVLGVVYLLFSLVHT